LHSRSRTGVEVLAFDRGPGMGNLSDCLRDGFSTAGSPGTGLGAISRMSSSSAFYTLPAQGSIVEAVCWSGETAVGPPDTFDIAEISIPAPGETECGDICTFRLTPSGGIFMIADGLGHGPLAAEAARKAAEVFYAAKDPHAGSMLEAMHSHLHGTRGAAVGIAEIDLVGGSLRFAGIGNIAGAVVEGDDSRHLVSLNGIVGHLARRVKEFDVPWGKKSILILHSDGISTKWDVATYPGTQAKPPGVLAGAIYRDFKRGRDDTSIQVARAI
jgi:Stage II sporulation protein E (SpoIIE)